MLLENKTAIVFGAAGTVGSALARTFATLASARAGAITGTAVNLTCGSVLE